MSFRFLDLVSGTSPSTRCPEPASIPYRAAQPHLSLTAASDSKESITRQTYGPSLGTRDDMFKWEYDRAADSKNGVLRIIRKAHCDDPGDKHTGPEAT
jgi:hypothetical protein